MHSESQVRSLRRLYNRTLWSYIGIAALSVAATAFLVVGNMINNGQALHWVVAAWVGLALAAVEYIIERTLYRKGKKGAFILPAFMMGLLALYVLFMKSGLIDGLLLLFYPLVLGFVAGRPLIPAISLLRDAGALRDGDLSEAVGRIKAGTHRKNTESGRGAYVLFEDELTREVHLFHMGHISPLHRYRVFYLPHSGLAVGEVIPDNVTFDPFGNPIEREVEEPITEKPDYSEESYAEKADYTEESYTVKPDYKEEPTEKPWYQNPEAFSANPPKPEPREDTSMPDPNSPERIRAANFGKASKICKVLTFVFMGVMFFGVITTQSPSMMALFFLMIPMIILSEVFKSKELKIRCTRRTTGFCVDTVRRKSGKHSHRYPIVEFEAGGVTHTVELSVSCSRDAVGDIYTLYYDPLDPDVVRP
ncbi:MAG: hypothetical protein IJ363_14550 [Clostridia bacterium]|nr:hypothetical protein [Clostridia bacterium]